MIFQEAVAVVAVVAVETMTVLEEVEEAVVAETMTVLEEVEMEMEMTVLEGEKTMILITSKKIHTMTQLTTIMPMTLQTLISRIARHTLNIGYGILHLVATKMLQMRQTVNVHPQQSVYKMEIYSALMELMLLHTVPMTAIFVTHV